MTKISIKKTVLVVIVVVLLALFGYFMLFSTIKSKNEQVSLLSQQIELYVDRENNLHASDNLVEELHEQITELDSYFLAKGKEVSFIELVEKAGAKSGVTVTIGSVGVLGAPVQPSRGVQSLSEDAAKEAVANDKAELLTLRVDVQGSWSNVMQFVSYMENVPYKISIDKVAFNKASSLTPFFKANPTPEKTSTQWDVSFEINVLTL